MREHKFRGKKENDGKWIHGDLLHDLAKHSYIRYYFGITGVTEEVIPKTVGQWTGLKDTDGVDVYEGDVWQGDVWEYDAKTYPACKYKRNQLVKWFKEEGAFGFTFNKEEYSSCSMKISRISTMGKIIGNIYDNPELLEGVKISEGK